MALNQTPASERIHIGFFGRRNAGKSSVMNAVTGQNLAVVSDVKGTTTDPVYNTIELLPDVKESVIEKLTINAPLTEINDELIEELSSLVNRIREMWN